jgi:hypothetical protein
MQRMRQLTATEAAYRTAFYSAERTMRVRPPDEVVEYGAIGTDLVYELGLDLLYGWKRALTCYMLRVVRHAAGRWAMEQSLYQSFGTEEEARAYLASLRAPEWECA